MSSVEEGTPGGRRAESPDEEAGHMLALYIGTVALLLIGSLPS